MQKSEFFSRSQLTLIGNTAVVCSLPCERDLTQPPPPSDEMAVYELIAGIPSDLTPEQLDIIKFCAQECEHQKSGAFSVYLMVNAWNMAMIWQAAGETLNEARTLKLAEMVEPSITAGWRTTTVTIGGIVTGTSPQYVQRDMTELGQMLEEYSTGQNPQLFGQPLTPQWLYERFEDIHPREDGNGRTGKIIFNWLMGTLNAPQFPNEPERFSH